MRTLSKGMGLTMIKNNLVIVFFAVLMGIAVGLSSAGFAEEMSQAKAIDVKGDVMFLKAGTSSWESLQKDMILGEGDALKTGKYSEAKLTLFGTGKTGELLIKEESEFNFRTLRHDVATKTDDTQLDVEIGSVLVKAEKLIGTSRFEVKTPTSIVGIRGTTFEVIVSKA